MTRWLIAVLLAAGLHAQTQGTLRGRIVGQGAGPLRGEVLVVMAGGAIGMTHLLADEQGVFQLDLPPGPVLLVARAEGYVSEERQVTVRPGRGNPQVSFLLAPAGSISGRVYDQNGAGVPGARVWVGYLGEARAWRLADEAGGQQADAFGYFTIPAVAQGRPFLLHAQADGWLPSSSDRLVLRTAELSGVVLLLSRRGATLRGRVVDAAGNPLPGVEVHLRVHPAAGQFTAEQRASLAFTHATNQSTRSAADGSYAFAAVPAGQVVVTARDGARRAVAEADARPGTETPILLTLR